MKWAKRLSTEEIGGLIVLFAETYVWTANVTDK